MQLRQFFISHHFTLDNLYSSFPDQVHPVNNKTEHNILMAIQHTRKFFFNGAVSDAGVQTLSLLWPGLEACFFHCKFYTCQWSTTL
jgi:hypothetical protein